MPTKEPTFMQILSNVLQRNSTYTRTIPTEKELFSMKARNEAARRNLYTPEGYLAEASNLTELTQKQREEYDELLAYDPSFAVYELLETHLELFHPEARLNPETLELTGMEYEGTFIEELLALLIKEFKTPSEKLLEDTFFRTTYFMKDLCYGLDNFACALSFFHDLFRDMSLAQEKTTIERLQTSSDSPEDKKKYIQSVKEMTSTMLNVYDDLRDRVLEPESFEKLYRWAAVCAQRYSALKPYERELEEQALELRSGWLIKVFVINADHEEFSDFLSQIKRTVKPEKPSKREISLPKNLQIKKALSMKRSDLTPEFSKVYEDSKVKIDGRLYFMKDGKPFNISAMELVTLTVIAGLYGDRPTVIFCSDILKGMGLTGRSRQKEQIEAINTLVQRYMGVLCTMEYRMTYKDTGQYIELTPSNQKEIEAFRETDYEFTEAKLDLACRQRPVLLVKEFFSARNTNGKMAACFLLEDQPQLDSIAKTFKQIIKAHPETFQIGLQREDELGWALALKFVEDINYDGKIHWTYDCQKLLEDLKADISILKDKKKKMALFNKIEKILSHFQSIGLLDKYRTCHEANRIAIYPSLYNLDNFKDKERARKEEANSKRAPEKIDKEFYQHLTNFLGVHEASATLPARRKSALTTKTLNIYYYPNLTDQEKLPLIETPASSSSKHSYMKKGLLDVKAMKRMGVDIEKNNEPKK